MNAHSPRLSYRRLLVAVGILALVVMALIAPPGSPNGKLVFEWLTGETPQAKVGAYVLALALGNKGAALAWWGAPDDLSDRRAQVVSELLASGLSPRFSITRIEWWSTCCEPHVIHEPRGAGGARVRVQLYDRQGAPLLYTFDIFVSGGAYWGPAANYPLRHWVIRDIYPDGDAPLFWRW
jgi:hypothetical protein